MKTCLKYLTVTENKEIQKSEINEMASKQIKQIIGEIRKLPSVRKNGDLIFDVPDTTKNIFPKQMLVEHVETKWEKFAKTKGIKKKKKSQMVYDEELKEYVQRFGPYSKKNLAIKAGIYEDDKTVSALRRERKKNIEKNKKQMLANKTRYLTK